MCWFFIKVIWLSPTALYWICLNMFLSHHIYVYVITSIIIQCKEKIILKFPKPKNLFSQSLTTIELNIELAQYIEMAITIVTHTHSHTHYTYTKKTCLWISQWKAAAVKSEQPAHNKSISTWISTTTIKQTHSKLGKKRRFTCTYTHTDYNVIIDILAYLVVIADFLFVSLCPNIKMIAW